MPLGPALPRLRCAIPLDPSMVVRNYGSVGIEGLATLTDLAALARRSNLTPLLNVLRHESANPLLRLPNVVPTSPIVSTLGTECLRLGRLMVDECWRWFGGESQWQITSAQSSLLA